MQSAACNEQKLYFSTLFEMSEFNTVLKNCQKSNIL